MRRDTIETNMKMARQTREAYSEIRQIHADTAAHVRALGDSSEQDRIQSQEQLSSRDRRRHDQRDDLRDVRRNPLVSDSYERVWDLGNDEFILSNDQMFDPNTLPGVDAKLLRQR